MTVITSLRRTQTLRAEDDGEIKTRTCTNSILHRISSWFNRGCSIGVLADTESRTKVRTSKCTEANIDNVIIPARIQGPSFEDPFRFLGVKWLTLSTAGAARHFIKPRDYLLLESSGMALDSDGERFCYSLSHSIVLDENPEFNSFDFVRQTFSASHIIRPSETEGEVEVFSRGFTNSAGSLAERLSMNQYCDVVMAVPQMIEEAFTRKLVWLLQAESRGGGSLCLTPASTHQSLDSCHSCNDKLNSGIGKLFDYSMFSLSAICVSKVYSQEIVFARSTRVEAAEKSWDQVLSEMLFGSEELASVASGHQLARGHRPIIERVLVC